MTNPNNAIGTNGAYGGRTSVDAFNDDLAVFASRGVVAGFVVSPDSGLTVSVGGDGITRDVAVAEDNVGNKTTINNISKSPISITISGAPANNSRIDSIVAYVQKPAQGNANEVDNPSACGLIVVEGAVAASPVAPSNSDIRTAITNDGAGGTVAYYVVLGNITIPAGTTTITSNMISQGAVASFQSALTNIPDNSITGTANAGTGGKLALDTVGTENINWTSLGAVGNYSNSEMETPFKDWNGDTIYRTVVYFGALPNNSFKYVSIASLNIKNVMRLEGISKSPSSNAYLSLPAGNISPNYCVSLALSVNNNNLSIAIGTGVDRSSYTETYIEILYTKN